MGRGNKRKGVSREQEIIDLVNDAIVRGDAKALRQIAAVKGLVSASVRKRAWPLLLGVPTETQSAALPDMLHGSDNAGRAQRDRQTVANDVARCLHEAQIADVGQQDRDALRAALTRLLLAVVDGENVFYYQGLHEIAVVLLMQVGEAQAYPLLRRLACTQLRDNTRANLDAVTESLNIVHAVIAAESEQLPGPSLWAHLRRAELPPYFAISWVITWFAHNVKSSTAPRLFDLFLASHPLMPLYLYTAGVLEAREKLLALNTMEELHTFLVNFSPFDAARSVDKLVHKAVRLINKHPPPRMARRCEAASGRSFAHCCTVEAKVVADAWWVPEVPPKPPPRTLQVLRRAGASPLGKALVGSAAAAAIGVATAAVVILKADPADRITLGGL